MSKSSLSGLGAGRPSSDKSKNRLMESLKDEERLVRMNFDIPETLHKKLRIYAIENNVTVKDLMKKYVETLVS